MQCPVCQSEKMCGHKTTGIISVALLVIVAGYFLLKGSYQAPTLSPTQTPTTEREQLREASPTTQAPAASVREISVSGTEFSFNPASISVKAGEKVNIIFKNNGGSPHNLIVEELNIKTKTIGRGEQDTIEFIAPSSGTYTFFCSIPGHRASGMEGSLKVE